MSDVRTTYWDAVASVSISTRRENILKRCEIVRRILERPPMNERVLEIGVGKGYMATAVSAACCGSMKYIGTELAQEFIDFCKNMAGLNVIKTDILSLPDGPFDQVWLFDTMEHVAKDERQRAYQEINRVLAEHAIICLHLPLSESEHFDEFDPGIEDSEVMELAVVCGCRVVKWEAYTIQVMKRSYAYVVLQR
jgi:SAM-dependent methyltransferase